MSHLGSIGRSELESGFRKKSPAALCSLVLTVVLTPVGEATLGTQMKEETMLKVPHCSLRSTKHTISVFLHSVAYWTPWNPKHLW